MQAYVSAWHGPGPDEAAAIFVILAFVLIGFLVLTIAVIKVLIWCKLFSKAGYSWALGLLTLLPIVDIVMYFFLAFADWPVRKELRLLKSQQKQKENSPAQIG
jgi:hypothetical protein